MFTIKDASLSIVKLNQEYMAVLGELAESDALWYVAEEVGFEPTIRSRRMPVFETGAFNRSATPPRKRHASLV